jgi:hypothetical protein
LLADTAQNILDADVAGFAGQSRPRDVHEGAEWRKNLLSCGKDRLGVVGDRGLPPRRWLQLRRSVAAHRIFE